MVLSPTLLALLITIFTVLIAVTTLLATFAGRQSELALSLSAEISQRKRTEEDLRRSEVYLAEAQRLSHIGSWAFNVATRRIIHSSAEYHRLFGFDSGGVIPDWDDWVRRIHPEDRETTRDTIEQRIRERMDFELDYRVVHPDGTIKYLHALGHPVLNPSGDLVEFVGTSIDLTERKLAEAEARGSEQRYREIQRELAHANRIATMGQLTASITHEVKQPIAASVTNAEAALRWLDRQPPDLVEVRQTLARIVKDGIHAGEVVERIRDLIKKAPPRKDHFEINGAIHEIVELTHGETMKNSILVRTEFEECLPLIQGDRVQLQQVMLNLIINAVDAMSGTSEGSRELLISTEKSGWGDVLVVVRDSGPGLMPESLECLFDAFYTTKPKGLGLGLSICRSIVEEHGGKLWASANVPRGAAFRFTLPA
jgi:PAS domain S-box-containing protein